MEQIRVLQIGMHDNLGGVENFIMNYYRNIDRKVIQFDFINIYDKICYEKEIKQLGGKIYNVSNAKKNPFKYYKQLKKILTKNKYEIIHINLLSFANILPILVRFFALLGIIISQPGSTCFLPLPFTLVT